jgi:hypothetical protein
MHTARAAKDTQAQSTFDTQQQNFALKRMSNFISTNISNIRRLSRLPTEYDFNDVLAAYGKQAASAPVSQLSVTPRGHAQASSEVSFKGTMMLRARGNTPPLPAPQAVRVNMGTPSLESNGSLNYRHLPVPGLPTQKPTDTAKDTSASFPSANVASVHLNRRLPPRSSTPLPASPRASLALSAASSRRKVSGTTPPLPSIPDASTTLSTLKMMGNMNGDLSRFQQVRAHSSS